MIAMRWVGTALALLSALVAAPARAADDDVLLEIHYEPVPDLQVAIWLTDADGNFVQDVFVTQSTGTLGIGNRPGRWDFLSSWRFPYGERPQVLPVWAHARGGSYPHLIFHDETDVDSLGWHENRSSDEPYFCRPLTPEEQLATLEADVMSCPSPAVFRTDKGRFDGPATSPYPPRSDIFGIEEGFDHPDVLQFAAINDLDAITGATPAGDEPTMVTAIVPRAVAETGPLVVWIEANLEGDENADFEFDREDQWIDPDLDTYGVSYWGQPSVVYRVELDTMQKGFTGTDAYAGYGEFDGLAGTLNPPDATISTNDRSGADRLLLHEQNGEVFRFGVYSHGPMSGQNDPDEDGWGSCRPMELPAVDDFVLEAVAFDTVRVHFTVPPLDDATDVRAVTLYYRPGDMPIDETNASSAIQVVPTAEDCDLAPASDTTTWCELSELFGNYEYQVAMRYADSCNNESPLVADAVKTPAQEFATVEGACFVATAAWGAAWEDRVAGLRSFRDRALRPSTVGAALVAFYRAHGPLFARAIAPRPWARAAARRVLAPVSDVALLWR
jgi:hypothetical protein